MTERVFASVIVIVILIVIVIVIVFCGMEWHEPDDTFVKQNAQDSCHLAWMDRATHQRVAILLHDEDRHATEQSTDGDRSKSVVEWIASDACETDTRSSDKHTRNRGAIFHQHCCCVLLH